MLFKWEPISFSEHSSAFGYWVFPVDLKDFNKGFILPVSKTTVILSVLSEFASLLPSLSFHTFFFNGMESNWPFTQRWNLCKGNKLLKHTSKTKLKRHVSNSRSRSTVLFTGVINLKKNLHRTETLSKSTAALDARPLGGHFCKAVLLLSLKSCRDKL